MEHGISYGFRKRGSINANAGCYGKRSFIHIIAWRVYVYKAPVDISSNSCIQDMLIEYVLSPYSNVCRAIDFLSYLGVI